MRFPILVPTVNSIAPVAPAAIEMLALPKAAENVRLLAMLLICVVVKRVRREVTTFES